MFNRYRARKAREEDKKQKEAIEKELEKERKLKADREERARINSKSIEYLLLTTFLPCAIYFLSQSKVK